MRWTGIYICFLLLLPMNSRSQQTVYKFWIQLKDKDHNSYSLDNPGGFLSQRAIDRRNRQNIPITIQDLPVSKVYLDSLSIHPLKILYSSKWMNAAIIQTQDSSLAVSLPEHTFIESVEYLYRKPWTKKSAIEKWNKFLSVPDIDGSPEPDPDASVEDNLGAFVENNFELSLGDDLVSDHQVKMLNGHLLHQEGYEGQGMHIAVLDLGFINTDNLVGFDSLFLSGRILGTRNFVEPDSNFYWIENGSHGTNVLSAMGGNIPGEYKGSAPGASYWLIQTEDFNSEFRIEEANWLAGAELADSAGVDIINSSLGYLNVFTDPIHNYSYSDMNGKTALVTRAAQIAATKGILVIASAGNAGGSGNSWGYITAPADGDSVLAVGAVDSSGIRADFSSYGPSFDLRIKPDVVAQGVRTWLIDQSGILFAGNGTSFSSPVVAGLAACLWQKNPEISNYELLKAIRQSGSINQFPDTLRGYGIPDFYRADTLISGISFTERSDHELFIYPNPATHYILFEAKQILNKKTLYQVYDINGRLALSGVFNVSGRKELKVPIQSLGNGSYFLILRSGNTIQKGIFVKYQ